MAAEQVGNRCDFVRREAVGVGFLAQASALDGGGLECFVAQDALVDDIVSVAESISFMGSSW